MGAHREDDGDTLDAVGLDLLEAQRRVRAIVCREGRDGNARLVALAVALGDVALAVFEVARARETAAREPAQVIDLRPRRPT